MSFNNKYLTFCVKLIFGLAVFIFVGWKVNQMIQSESYNGPFQTQYAWELIGLIMLLMTLNWSVEALKWKFLMQALQPLTFKAAIIAVLAGVSTGIITPNRLGNFIGRTITLDKDIRIKATLLTFLSNLSQFVPTIFFGCLGLVVITSNYSSRSVLILFCAGIVLLVLALALYIYPKLADRKPLNYFFTVKIKEAIDFIESTPLPVKLRLLGLSALRYSIFVCQYMLLLIVFDQKQGVFILLANISVVYLIMTIVPGLLMGKLFVREAAGLIVLANIGVPDLVILLTGFILWLINIGLPSLIGASLLLGKK